MTERDSSVGFRVRIARAPESLKVIPLFLHRPCPIMEHLPRELAQFCASLPKVELHAHLNGSCRDSTLRELAATAPTMSPSCAKLLSVNGDRTLAECFQLFDVIHNVTTSHEAITRITLEMCEDMASDSVMYAEIRTTPKNRPEHGITKRSYIDAVLAGVRAFHSSNTAQTRADAAAGCSSGSADEAAGAAAAHERQQGLTVRLLLSIDRREGTAAAQDTVRLAAEYAAAGVVGVDLSGNPTIGDWDTWLPALVACRKAGLAVTVHAGEVPNIAEVDAILAFVPDRVGHLCCASEAQELALMSAGIPLELCLTSNVRTESVKGYPGHHLGRYLQRKHPVVLCTDDSGVFQTTLSKELAHAAHAFSLQEADMVTLVEYGIQAAFVPEDVKTALTRRLQHFLQASSASGAI
eukprot:jgi/Ulvmu1/1317/UM011_0045.1